VSEIRLDVRLLRPGALVAGVAAGRCVLVRAVPEPGGAGVWAAALEAGLPVPEVREARCGERHVLVAVTVDGQALSPAVGDVARSQAVALGLALQGCGIAVSQLRRADLAVRDGALVVRAPVFGPADGGGDALAAMVAEACAPEAVAAVPRRQRAVPAAIVAVAVLAVVVSLVPWPGSGGPQAPRAAAAVAPVTQVALPEVEPAAAPRPPVARERKPVAKPKVVKAKKPRVKKRRRVAPAAAEPPVGVRPVAPRPRAVTPPADDVPPAGGDADPLPAL
jgi:hypothetical protein